MDGFDWGCWDYHEYLVWIIPARASIRKKIIVFQWLLMDVKWIYKGTMGIFSDGDVMELKLSNGIFTVCCKKI